MEKNKVQNKEHIRKRVESRQKNGKSWHSEKTKREIGIANTGKISPLKGRKGLYITTKKTKKLIAKK